MEIKLKSGRKFKVKETISLDERDSLLDNVEWNMDKDGNMTSIKGMNSTMTKWFRACIDGDTSDEELIKWTIEDRTDAFIKIQEHLNLSDKLNLEVEASLRQIHKRKRLSKQQKEVAREITNIVIANEDPPNWLAKAGRYAAEPTDRNHERVKEVQDVAYEHQVDDFLAGILYASVHEGEK